MRVTGNKQEQVNSAATCTLRSDVKGNGEGFFTTAKLYYNNINYY